MTLTPITEFDVVYISYDEPNAENNWQDLLTKCPWAKRSHGVYGSDAAHKAAASLSETNRFITVDADNIVDSDFFNIELETDDLEKDSVISWAARNEVNGLVYGNGGIKCWPVHVVRNMRTHESAVEHDAASQVDFCWNVNYVQMNNVYSHVYNNATPHQAWRAGFREGVKMTLEDGDVVDRNRVTGLNKRNLNRLMIWQSVGADVENGNWAIYGARMGCVMANLERDKWDWKNVRDFEWLNKFWNEQIAEGFDQDVEQNYPDFDGVRLCSHTAFTYHIDHLRDEIKTLGDQIRDKIGLNIADLDEQSSKFFKQVYTNPARVHPLTREIDAINETE